MSGAELAFELPGGGRALFTTRYAGNLSTGAGDSHELGMHRREQICEQLGLGWLCSSRQVHGAAVHVIERASGAGGEPVPIDADAHATALSQVGAMVLGADCLPVALGCDGAIAMVHAGWRGLAAGVLEEGVLALRALATRTRPDGVKLAAGGEQAAASTLAAGGEQAAASTRAAGGAQAVAAMGVVAIIGPGAGVCCYEVGAEVQAALGEHWELGRHARGRHVDLRAIARERLLAAGVSEVRDVEACTICDRRFFSHRREGSRAGRQAGVAWLS